MFCRPQYLYSTTPIGTKNKNQGSIIYETTKDHDILKKIAILSTSGGDTKYE